MAVYDSRHITHSPKRCYPPVTITSEAVGVVPGEGQFTALLMMTLLYTIRIYLSTFFLCFIHVFFRKKLKIRLDMNSKIYYNTVINRTKRSK